MIDFKKSLAIVTAICSMGTISTLPVSADINADIDGDGEVSAMDVLLVKKNIFNIIPQTAFKFDINNDGFVNVIDMNLVKRELANPTTTKAPQTTTAPPQTTKAPTTTKATTTTPEVTEPPVTEPPQTDPPQTQAPVEDNSGKVLCADGNYYPPTMVIYDKDGNAYPNVGYAISPGGFAYVVGNNYDEQPQLYADAASAYYGISMTTQGRYVMPTAMANYTLPDESSDIWAHDEWGFIDYDATNERAEAWRAGRSMEQIPIQELLDNLFYVELLGLDYVSYLGSLGLFIQL